MKGFRLVLLTVLLLVPLSLIFAQKFQIKTDAKKNKLMIVGECHRSDLQTDSFALWFNKEYQDYKIDLETLSQIKPLLKGLTVTLVMATWCSDSRQQVPRFYKITDSLKFKSKKVKLICVDRDKKAPGVDVESMKIQLVPTFIFTKKGVELGRIIESPAISLEKDLLRILSESLPKSNHNANF